MTKKPIDIGLNVLEIQGLHFYINEDLELPEDQTPVFNINLGYTLDVASERFGFNVEGIFHLPDDPSLIILSGKARTTYHVENMSSLIKNGEDSLDLPDQAIITMLSIAISHLRALMAQHVRGTKFAHVVLPIVNPTVIFQQFVTQINKVNQ